MTKMNRVAFAAASAALVAHRDELGIEGNAETQLFHLLLSLHEYCGAQGISLDKVLMDVRNGLASGELQCPSWRASHQVQEAIPLGMLQVVHTWLGGAEDRSRAKLMDDVEIALTNSGVTPTPL